MEIRHFLEHISEPGGPFSPDRLSMIRKALATSSLIPKRYLDDDGAAWIIYTALGARTTVYSELLLWLQDRKFERSLNPVEVQPVEVIKSILTSPKMAKGVDVLAVSRPHGVLVVLLADGSTRIYPQRTIEPAQVGGTMGIMGKAGILKAVEAITNKTEAYVN